eukprot:TRINITY_DN11728_c0_g1_i1.p2 TRINITY_DN11728_c0_g1~~TRINITY_DN11728_c0_g1_i1.p2  ORF type:complete len:211 (+),score=44.06 TRINITY_DN11728_c0_g1_i1:69-635(+)
MALLRMMPVASEASAASVAVFSRRTRCTMTLLRMMPVASEASAASVAVFSRRTRLLPSAGAVASRLGWFPAGLGPAPRQILGARRAFATEEVKETPNPDAASVGRKFWDRFVFFMGIGFWWAPPLIIATFFGMWIEGDTRESNRALSGNSAQLRSTNTDARLKARTLDATTGAALAAAEARAPKTAVE